MDRHSLVMLPSQVVVGQAVARYAGRTHLQVEHESGNNPKLGQRVVRQDAHKRKGQYHAHGSLLRHMGQAHLALLVAAGNNLVGGRLVGGRCP